MSFMCYLHEIKWTHNEEVVCPPACFVSETVELISIKFSIPDVHIKSCGHNLIFYLSPVTPKFLIENVPSYKNCFMT
jgi:hypothetical protein